MEQIKCPICKGSVTVTADRAAWFETTGEPVILGHTPPLGRDRMPGTGSVKHIGSYLCLASGCSVSLAEGIAADRAAGVHLLPHP